MTKDWNVDRVISECQKMYYGANDQYMTGWNQWPCKQDLYRVKFALDEMLNNTATFSGEQEWLAEQQKQRDQQQVWKALNDVQNLR